MKRKRIVLAVGVCVFIAVVAGVLWPGEKEPVYHGKSLSEWMERYSKGGSADPVARGALEAIGTNALPCLLRWVQYHPSAFQKTLVFSITGKLFGIKTSEQLAQRLWGKRAGRSWQALEVFAVLGTNAAPAVPELTRSMHDWREPWDSHREVSARAIICLAHLGPAAFPSMLDALAHTNFPGREKVIQGLVWSQKCGVDISPSLPALLECLKDVDPHISARAALTLGQTGLKPEISVPAIIGRMTNTNDNVRRGCVVALGKFGAAASNALPQLILALRDPSEDVRDQSTNAIRRIAPQLVGTLVQADESEKAEPSKK